jgi:hypothetical protein
MRILLAAVLGTGALLLGTAAPGGAAQMRHPMGVVPHHVSTVARLSSDPGTTPPLAFQGQGGAGRVMETNTVYAIYWMPVGSTCSGSPCDAPTDTYEANVNRYFSDVQAANGTNNNVYSVATQYCQGVAFGTTSCNGGGTPIAYNETFGGSYVDHTAYPVSGCTATTVCLTDAQLQQEILADIATNGWPEDTSQPSHLYFIFTPSNVSICFTSGNSQCSTNSFCAYHDNFVSGPNNIAYAVEPDNATLLGCTLNNNPNNSATDPTINTISHEQNEAITDPWPETNPGWWANDGNQDEIGDLCAWYFMSLNQINGTSYYLQDEYSNANNSCESSYTPGSGGGGGGGGGGTPPPAIVTNPVVSGVAAVGQTLTSTQGAWTNSPTAYAYQWQQCSSLGTSCTNISGATGSSYQLQAGDAGHEVRSEVEAENAGGWSGFVPSAATEPVVPAPSNSVAPAVSGVAAVGKTLSTTEGSWNTPVTYTYQWLRCTGSSCSSIPNAQDSSYTVVSADHGHTLEAEVFATNASATVAAISNASSTVIATPSPGKLPHITGKAAVGRKLSADTGAWSDTPTAFRYQWLRCSATGGSCSPIAGATSATHKLTKKDAKHRLRVEVTAVNAAGSATARSAATKTVIAPKRG